MFRPDSICTILGLSRCGVSIPPSEAPDCLRLGEPGGRLQLGNQHGDSGDPADDLCLLGIAKGADWNW